MIVTTTTTRKVKEENIIQRELRKVIKNLKKWSVEISKHHEEIAVRNFSIGIEVHGFCEQYPPRKHPEYNLMEEMANSVGFSVSYIGLLSKIAGWLYYEKGIKNIRSFMRENNYDKWSHIMRAYFIASGKTEDELAFRRRFLGARTGLMNFKAVLPKSKKDEIDLMIKKITELGAAKLRKFEISK